MPRLLALAVLTLVTVLAGCGPRYVKGTEIEYSDDKQEVANVVERYRLAVESRDVDALRSLASRNYYENGSTTNDPADDYNYDGLVSVLSDVKDAVKAVRLEIDIKDISVLEEMATVDFEYRSQYLFTTGEQDKWATAGDKNRLTMRREQNRWRIVSGM